MRVITISILLCLNLSCVLQGTKVDTRVAIQKACHEIFDFIEISEFAFDTGGVCISDQIVVPNYIPFESVIKCSEFDSKLFVKSIDRGFTCESQYVNNLQHEYVNTWDFGQKKHDGLEKMGKNCSHLLYFSDFQNSHLYALLVDVNDLLDSSSYVLNFVAGTEFMFRLNEQGAIEQVYVIQVQTDY